MDLGNPWALFSGLIISVVGMALFMVGRKQSNFKALGTGIVLCVYPYFVASVLLLWVIFAACMAALYWLSRNA